MTYRWYQKGMWMFVPWCPMAIVIFALNAPTDFRNGAIIGTTLGGLIIAGLSYLLLVALVNRTELVLTHTTLRWREGPLPWPGAPKVLPTQQIVQFFVEAYEVSDTKNRPKRRYALSVLMEGGTSVTLFGGQKRNHELLMIEGELESWLGLEHFNPNAAVSTERLFSVNPRKVFAAFEQPDRLAQWWGPSGFTNTFELFEFKPGGRWVFVMHGPNGANYPNESVFREIQPDTRIVIEHVVKPWYRLTVTLTARGDKTHLAWVQEFESPEAAAKMRRLSETANEQNLDRLQSVLASESA